MVAAGSSITRMLIIASCLLDCEGDAERITGNFATANNSLYEVREGQDAHLRCQLAPRHRRRHQRMQASWMRRRDSGLDLLTVGRQQYTSDDRFASESSGWMFGLRIASTTKADDGLYLCQISTPAGPEAIMAELIVKEPLVSALGSDSTATAFSSAATKDSLFYQPGSEVELRCLVRGEHFWRADVTWSKDNHTVDLNHDNNLSTGSQVEADHFISRLWIRRASASDSGLYMCVVENLADVELVSDPSKLDSATLNVHVMQGEFHAAVHGDALVNAPSIVLGIPCVYLITLLI